DAATSALVLATAGLDGSDRRILLRADGEYSFLRNPAWSPDGTQVAIVRSSGGVAGEIWIVPTAGGPPVQLSKDPVSTSSDEPVFTPDGSAIIHSSNRGGAMNIWMLPRTGQAAVRLTTGPGPDTSPTIARDGAIAFL